MATATQIESSSYIQSCKNAYDAAKAAGDEAGMAAAHAAANAYRESQGGYTHQYTEGGGTNFDVVYTTVNTTGTGSSGSSGGSSSGSGSAGRSGSSGSTSAPAQTVTVIDSANNNSSYNPTTYTETFGSGKSLLSVGDDVLGYGLMAFIVVALVSKVLR